MGVYDSVMVSCPRCGQENEFQSKYGRCRLYVFKLKDAPDDVMKDVNRHAPCECGKCGCFYQVDVATRTPVEVGAEKTRQHRGLVAMELEDLAQKVRTGEVKKVHFSWDGGVGLKIGTPEDEDKS